MKVATFGEIMMRLSTLSNNRICQSSFFEVSFAGSEANVAVDIAIWGEKSLFISSVPNNELGDAVIYDLGRYKVDTNFIKILPNSRLGTLYIEHGASYRKSKVLYDRKNSAFSNNMFTEDFFHSAFNNCDWFHWTGITPGLGLSSIENIKKAIKVAKHKEMTISCDLNYRAKLWDFNLEPKEIMPELLQDVDILLGNEEDAQLMFDIEFPYIIDVEKDISHDLYKNICSIIFKRLPKCSIISFTIRESQSADYNNWSGILATKDEFYISNKYRINNIVDRVGSGDSFSAGIIYGLNHFKYDYQKTLDFAIAASCLKHSIKGDYCLCTTNEIFKLMSGSKSGRIER